MEYLMLMSIVLTLFFGLLFLGASIGRIENEVIKIMIEIVSVTVIIVSNIIVIVMTIWDIYTRRKNIGKRNKKKRRSYDSSSGEHSHDYDFHFNWKKWNVSSSDDSKLTINQILDDLFSFKRLKRKLFLVQRKGKKIVKNVKVIQKSIKQMEDSNFRKSMRLFLKDVPQVDK
jgi:ABC-type nickel/cobalt efflux system permease component RcnA